MIEAPLDLDDTGEMSDCPWGGSNIRNVISRGSKYGGHLNSQEDDDQKIFFNDDPVFYDPNVLLSEQDWRDQQPVSTITRGIESASDSLDEPAKPALLACPYLKYDPTTYGLRRSCRGAAFKTIHRLK